MHTQNSGKNEFKHMKIHTINLRGGSNHLNGRQLRSIFHRIHFEDIAALLISELRLDWKSFSNSKKMVENMATTNGVIFYFDETNSKGANTSGSGDAKGSSN